MDKHNIKSKTNYKQALRKTVIMIIIINIKWTLEKYFDMTPERRKCAVREAPQRHPLLANGSLTHLSPTTDELVETRELLRN
jgi:hypothetical protein